MHGSAAEDRRNVARDHLNRGNRLLEQRKSRLHLADQFGRETDLRLLRRCLDDARRLAVVDVVMSKELLRRELALGSAVLRV
jgi:hypothetical protein